MKNKMDFEKCGTSNTNKIISVEENKRKFTIDNSKAKRIVNKVKVDGCLINDTRKRCDYLFEIDDPMTAVLYVELKGCDIKKACKQLFETMNHLKVRHAELKKSCHIVGTRIPRASPTTQVLKARMQREHGVTLRTHTTEHTVKL